MTTTTTAATTPAPACGPATGLAAAENASPAVAGQAAPYATHPNTTMKEPIPMTDQTIPDLPQGPCTLDDVWLARDWASHILKTPGSSIPMEQSAARVLQALLPAPKRPTLADMTPEERAECQWMQADVIGGDEPLVITRIDRTDWTALILDRNGRLDGVPAGDVTPRPDLPRLEWPGDEKPAPALPDGWRLADHPGYGRVIVTSPTPDVGGHVYFVSPAPSPIGNDWHYCAPGELRYIDTEPEEA